MTFKAVFCICKSRTFQPLFQWIQPNDFIHEEVGSKIFSGFNPCFSGFSLMTKDDTAADVKEAMFQPLFQWIQPNDTTTVDVTAGRIDVFQPLFSWIQPNDKRKYRKTTNQT